MSIFEIQGGPMNRRYLERKTKHDLCDMYMTLLDAYCKVQARADLAAEREAQMVARTARLELGLHEVHALADGGESSMHEIVDVCRAWLKEHPRQSVAEIEARALERFRRALRGGTYMDDEWPGINFVEKWLQQEADRIRSEAKDSP